MPERTVKAVLASYRDADGVLRHALRGEVVDVGADDVGRFDRLNSGPPQDTAPKHRRARQPKPKGSAVGVKPVRCRHGQAADLLSGGANQRSVGCISAG